MRYVCIILLTFAFYSCFLFNINITENIQIYNIEYKKIKNDYNLIFEIQYKLLDSSGDHILYPELYFKYYNGGSINNGKMSLIFSNIDESICNDIEYELFSPEINFVYGNIIISNKEAKIKRINVDNIIAYDLNNNKIGYLLFGQNDSFDNSGIVFIYSTQNTEIKYEDDYIIFDILLYKGWNTVYCYSNKKVNITTNNKYFPKNHKWRLKEIK